MLVLARIEKEIAAGRGRAQWDKIDEQNACTHTKNQSGTRTGDKRESKDQSSGGENKNRPNHVFPLLLLFPYFLYFIWGRQLHVIHAPSSICRHITTRPCHTLPFFFFLMAKFILQKENVNKQLKVKITVGLTY